ncbi:MAG: CPBP family glutamic-type intramembrane protease [Candidatus Helarchaeota archaeon]
MKQKSIIKYPIFKELMINIKNFITKKQLIILITTIILTICYYFMALYYVRISTDRKNIVFFYIIFGSLFGDSIWLDFWQYIYQFLLAFILFFVVPILIIKYYFKEDLKKYAFQWGNKKFNLIWTIIGICIAPIFLFNNDPSLLHEYPLTRLVLDNIGLFIIYNAMYIFYYIGYEFIYRAYLQFGLINKNTKKELIVIISIQTIITTLFHIGKPLTEIVAAALVGPLFGYLTLKGKSFVWPVLIFHSLIGIIQNIAPFIWL